MDKKRQHGHITLLHKSCILYYNFYHTHTVLLRIFSSTFQIFCGNKIVEVVHESNHLYIDNGLTLSANG